MIGKQTLEADSLKRVAKRVAAIKKERRGFTGRRAFIE